MDNNGEHKLVTVNSKNELVKSKVRVKKDKVKKDKPPKDKSNQENPLKKAKEKLIQINKKRKENKEKKDTKKKEKEALEKNKELEKLKHCPKCKAEIELTDEKCPKCGYPVKKKRKKKKSRLKVLLNVFLILLMLTGIAVMIAALVFCGYIVMSAPSFNTDLLYRKEASIMYDKNGNEITKLGLEQRILVSYDDLPEVLIDAIVATEDARYFQHNGFDVVRFTKASFGQVVGQAGAGGASTLTMQVVKNTFTSKESHGFQGIVRKFTDIYMAVFKIEKNYTKEEIMEFYVNAPFLGSHTYGVEQACQTYFGKSVRDITLPEAALIAGIFNAPTTYSPFNSLELATQRRSTVLNLMVRHGYITQAQADEANAIPVESLLIDPKQDSVHKYQSFIDATIDDVTKKTGMSPYDVPMLIYTTLDPDIQDVLNQLNDGSLGFKWNDDKIDIGLVVMDVKDGSVAAIDGGRNVSTKRGFNRATMGAFQPGSIIKPFMDYGPYIEYNNGSPGTIFYDVPYSYSTGQKITNSDNTYKGAMTMRTALVESRNVPAVQAFHAVDKDKVAEFVHACGIDYGDTLYESYAIGGGMEVSPLTMGAAYATFARGGYYIEPYTFTKIVIQQTDEVIEYKVERTQAMSKETAYLINDMLVSATKNGVGGNINVSGTDVASKTGTSTYSYAAMRQHNVPDSASSDNWVITYSPDYVISFRYGYDELSHDYYTNAIKAAIERNKISALLANKIYKTNSRFPKPEGVISSKYEKESVPTELPSEFTPAELIGTELFKKGTEPSQISSRFAQLNNPTGLRGSENNGVVTLSWNAIEVPNAINKTYLQNYFKQAYGSHAETYLNRRIQYNDANIGVVGYDIFQRTANGDVYVGYTADTSFSTNVELNGTYTYIVKSAYSIFKANESSGVELTVTVTGAADPVEPDPEPEPDPFPDEEIHTP